MSINTPAPTDPNPSDPPYPAASPPARACIRALRQDGSTSRATSISAAPAAVRDLASGGRPARRTAAAVRAANADAIPRDRLDAGGTRLRLRALHVMGHG